MAGRRIKVQSAITVISAGILIGTEVLVAAVAGGWAIAGLLGLGNIGAYVLVSIGLVLAGAALWTFLKSAMAVEPIVE